MNKKLIYLSIIVSVALVVLASGAFDKDEELVADNSRPVKAQLNESLQKVTEGGKQENAQEKKGPKAYDFSLKDLNGETITLSSYAGKKPVVLDFFATWCHNCRRDMPKLSKMYDKYSDEVEVIGVNLRESKSKVKDFIEKKDISFPIVFDPRGVAAQGYGVRYTNYHVLIDKDGYVAGIVPGDIRESDILGLIEKSGT